MAAVVAAGCAGSGYTYVSSTSTGTFFKIPQSWKVYDKGSILAHTGQAGAAGAQAQVPFLAIIDADPKPSLDHLLPASTHPFGLARVRALSTQEHDGYSLASLRNEAINVDQLSQANAGSVQVLAAPTLLVHQGMRGTHLEYTVRNPDGTAFSVDQVGLVDAATQTVWLLLIGCQASCYAHYMSTIHQVVDSWTVKGK